MNNQPFTTRMDTDLLRRRAFINAKIDELTGANAIDFDAATLENTYADGDTVGPWVARRGGLSGARLGTPEFHARPSETGGVPAVFFAQSGEGVQTGYSIDWSGTGKATMATLVSSSDTSGVNGVAFMADGPDTIITDGGLGLYAVGGDMTGAIRPSGSSWSLERTAPDEFDGTLKRIIMVVDTSLSQSDEIKVWVNGVEVAATASGSEGIGNFQSTLCVRLGMRDAIGGEGLNGYLSRAIAMPDALSGGGVASLDAWLEALAATYA